MKHLIAGAALAAVIALPAAAALKNGDKAPEFKAKASLAGKEFDFDMKAALKKGPVVVYFYPAAFTQGCNVEAHTFAENADKFASAKTTIIGVSHDTIDRLNDFSADPQYCAGKFPVASDPDGAIAKSYNLNIREGRAGAKDSRGKDLITAGFTERTTFVITPDSKVIATLSSADDKVTPNEHAEKSLALVEGLKKK